MEAIAEEGVDMVEEGVDIVEEGVDMVEEGVDMVGEGVGEEATFKVRRDLHPQDCHQDRVERG